jgi:hypothetical protein
MSKLPKKKKLKKLKNRELPAERILNALAGILAIGYPYVDKRCVSCGVSKKDGVHHKQCIFREALKLVLKYYGT